MDYAHEKTEGMLDSLEKRLAHEYAQAERELTDKLDDYMWRHSVKDRIWLNKVANGEITWERYQQWKIGQVCIGERWTEMRDTIAEDMHHTNEIAGSIVNGYLPEVYALNHNYATYEAEVGALVDTSYTLYDRQTVERLMRDNPDMLPPPGERVSKKIRDGKDIRWNEQQLQSIATQSILQGEDLTQTANRLRSAFGDSFTIDDIRDIEHKTASQIARELTKKNKSAAIRNARTMMTGAQNAGRVDGYKRAKDMGIDLRQQWLATLDGRTRHEHRQLDGQIVDVGKPFKVDGYEIRFPGDPTAEAHLVYNCRCTLIAAIKGFEHDLSDTSSRYDANLEGMTYEEWKKAKEPKKRTVAEKPYDSKESYLAYKESLENDKWKKKKQEIVAQRDQEIDDLLNNKYGGNFFDQRQAIRDNESLTAEEKERLLEEIYEKKERFNEDKWQIERKYQTVIDTSRKDYLIVDLDYEGLKHRVGTETLSEGVNAINPNYWGGSFEYTNNCQRCSLATEIWCRGYDVVAMPCDSYGGLGAQAQLQWSFQDGERMHFGGGRDAIVGIVEQMEGWGDGSRAMVFTQPASGAGHVFNVVNDNGVVRFVDSQVGMIWGTDEQSVMEIYGGTVETSITTDLMRTDNTRIYELPEGWIKNRE